MKSQAGSWMVLLTACSMVPLAVCTAKPRISSAEPRDGALRTVTCGDVTAHFSGEPDENTHPPEFGIRRLVFEFARDPMRYTFQPRGTLHFSDWSFEVFSPDCSHVALLQDRFGPYHVVPVSSLRSYLLSQAEPAHIISVNTENAVVHCRSRWVLPRTLEVRGCGESELVQRHVIP
jgi:hypothetical protein